MHEITKLNPKSRENTTIKLKKPQKGKQTKNKNKCFIPGLQLILNRIPHIQGIDLAEAQELVRHDMAAIVTYPLRAGQKRKRDDTEEKEEEAEKPEPSKKKKTGEKR